MAADPVQVASNVYTTLFENDRVRLLEARISPGDGSVMHGHPDYVVYNLADGKVRFSSPSGEVEEVELPVLSAGGDDQRAPVDLRFVGEPDGVVTVVRGQADGHHLGVDGLVARHSEHGEHVRRSLGNPRRDLSQGQGLISARRPSR